jgi:nucleotide-binding universal stress UspA family protein
MSIREVLAATDFSEIGDEAVRVARQHAERFGARLHVLHVQEAEAGDAAQRLERLSKGTGATIPVVVRAPAGDPATEIARYAREHDVDLIVVGTHGRTGMSRALLGSVAERVIRTASCPVLAVPASAGQSRQVEPPPLPPSLSRCLACREPSLDLICRPCRARIRGEALRVKQGEERAGRISTG